MELRGFDRKSGLITPNGGRCSACHGPPFPIFFWAGKYSRREEKFRKHQRVGGGIAREHTMKAKITVTPKRAVVDPQGKAVQNALEHMGYQGIKAVHVGKYLEIEVDGDKEFIRKQIDEACHKLLSNPVIEDYHFELE